MRKGQRQSVQRGLRFLVVLLATSGSAFPQATPPSLKDALPKFLLCDSGQLSTAAQLSLRQRTCWYGSRLASPWAAARASFSSGLDQWKKDDRVRHGSTDEFAHRFAIYYAKRTAKESGEMLAGYLNHEDPRPRASGEAAVRRRIQSALLSVLVSRTDQGARPALGPLAGSLGSAFAGTALYRERATTRYALQGASLTYASYFGRALYQEFRPDISFMTKKLLHKNRSN